MGTTMDVGTAMSAVALGDTFFKLLKEAIEFARAIKDGPKTRLKIQRALEIFKDDYERTLLDLQVRPPLSSWG